MVWLVATHPRKDSVRISPVLVALDEGRELEESSATKKTESSFLLYHFSCSLPSLGAITHTAYLVFTCAQESCLLPPPTHSEIGKSSTAFPTGRKVARIHQHASSPLALPLLVRPNRRRRPRSYINRRPRPRSLQSPRGNAAVNR